MDPIQLAQRDLIRRMLDFSGLDATNLARSAGLSPSTVCRFMNRPVKHALSVRTMAALRSASGLPSSPDQQGYVVDTVDRVARGRVARDLHQLLLMWEELNPAERAITLRFIKTLRKPKRSQAA